MMSTIHPRLHWMEVTWAVVLVVVGIVTFIGIVTSTPDDQRDKDFMALMYGGLVWGVLAGLTVTARFRQWRIRKSNLVGSGG
jgi:di/tricarboxylate transporter